MVIKVKSNGGKEWCFVESFQVYKYGETGNIKATVCVRVDGTLSSPYVFRGDEFVEAKQIEEELGISKYLAAKKPFYSKLSDGFIASVKAGVNFNTGEYLPDKSTFSVYTMNGALELSETSGQLHLVRVTELTPHVKELMEEVCKRVASCKGDREQFILSRI